MGGVCGGSLALYYFVGLTGYLMFGASGIIHCGKRLPTCLATHHTINMVDYGEWSFGNRSPC